MSAFIVNNDTINRIVGFCNSLQFASTGIPMYLKHMNPLTQFNDDENGAVQALLQMNIEAVQARYDDRAEDLMPSKPYRFYEVEDSYNYYALVKALDCYIYQCSEGNVPEKLLYKGLSDLRNDICRLLVSESPEYEKAEWG